MPKPHILMTVFLLLWISTSPASGSAEASPQAVAWELVGGTVGGVVGAAIAITAIGEIAPSFEERPARVATVVSGLMIGGGLGAACGVLATGRLLEAEGHVAGCLLGALAGGLISAFTEPLFYLLGFPEEITEFLGFVFLPIAPAVGATIGYNVTAAGSP